MFNRLAPNKIKLFTPAFKKTQEFLKKVGCSGELQNLLTRASSLSVENIADELTDIFKNVSSLVAQKPLEEFLNSASRLIQAQDGGALQEALSEVKKIAHPGQKGKALKQLLLNNGLVNILANSIKEGSGFDQFDQLDKIFSHNLENTASEASNAASQANYKEFHCKLVRDLLRLFYQLLDVTLVNAGIQPVFMPKEQSGGGARPYPVPVPAPAAPTPKG